MKKILIVEDDSVIAELQKDYLEMSGYSVDVRHDGITGLQCLESNSYDLLLLDIMLPGMDGYEILRRIRNTKYIPVLLVSAKKEEVDKIRGLNLGADDYITKPFSPGELVARINAHIVRYERLKTKFSNGGSHSLIAIRGLEIHKDAMRVFINQNEVSLAQKEFELLVYLASNPNRVFGREELFEAVWGLDSLGDTSTITVHIARIREKIEADPSSPQYIETIWGAGYRFKV
ncbi:MAG: response regulator transcription factor [Ruminiclostridium sp.]|nr:response regulator transcription factor [Ruminiclostridium sp.]